MKVSAFAQVGYRTFPEDFEQHHDSSVDTPWRLADPREVRATFRDYLDGLMLAARSGFDGLVFTEHAQASYDMSANPSLTASALAYATESEGLDVAIFPAGRSLGKSREPVRVAEEYAAIDTVSGGRLVAGFPVGLPYDACLNNGIPPIELRPRFDENLELILRAWREDTPFAWNGTFSQLPSVNIWPRPQQRPRPPVWLTGIGNPGTIQIALDRDFGFNYFSWFGIKATGPRVFDRFWELADRQELSRNPYRLGLMQVVGVAETDAEAVRIFQPHVEYLFHKGPGAIKAEKPGDPGHHRPARAAGADARPVRHGHRWQAAHGGLRRVGGHGIGDRRESKHRAGTDCRGRAPVPDRQPARDAAVWLDAASDGDGQYRAVRRDRAPDASAPVD